MHFEVCIHFSELQCNPYPDLQQHEFEINLNCT